MADFGSGSWVAKLLERFAPQGLPVQDCLGELESQIETKPLVALKAPPGSGKTLLAPAALMESGGFSKVFVLEPRRVTARMPALALETVMGRLVGYRIRLESLWHQGETRLGYLTYGTALRIFLERPPGPNTLVVFDEFHERSWEADLLLAYLRALSAPPKLLLMSATLDLDALGESVPAITSDGRLHDVTLSWEKHDPQLLGRRDRLVSLVAERSLEMAQRSRGEQLIFLPGLGDIRAVAERLAADPLSGPIDILHSSLAESEIRRVVERPVAGFRRILSTDIAESSVTLPGVVTVIDSGLVRRPIRDSLDLGVTLSTVGASMSALEQRAGRAGRLGPGWCHRLLTKHEEIHRAAFPTPEMEQADYRTVVLFLAAARAHTDSAPFPWLHQPNPEKLSKATRWCHQHRLLSNRGDLTDRGRRVLELPLSVRIANFALHAHESGHSQRDILRWCTALESGPTGSKSEPIESRATSIDSRLAKRLAKILIPRSASGSKRSLKALLLACFSETLAEFCDGRAVCADAQQPALLFEPHAPTDSKLGLILSTHPRSGQGPRGSVGLFCCLNEELLWEELFEQFEEETRLQYDPSARCVREHRELRLGKLVLESTTRRPSPGPKIAEILAEQIPSADLGSKFHGLMRRLQLLIEYQPTQAQALEAVLGTSLSPESVPSVFLNSYLSTVTQWSKLSQRELLEHCLGLLPYPLVQTLKTQLPTTAHLPRRRTPVPIVYPVEGAPYLASKLQDFFGWEQPKLLDGQLELVLHLLAPNGRACQITTDLDSFWRGSYQQVRKDLRGRYPKHSWPEDPLSSN